MKDAYEGFSYYFKKCDPTHAHEQEFFERLGYIDLQNHASAIRMSTGVLANRPDGYTVSALYPIFGL